VSSTMSWSRPAAMATTSISCRPAGRRPRGDGRGRAPGVPDWPLCSKAEKAYARLSSSISASGCSPDLFHEVLEPDHGQRCLTSEVREDERGPVCRGR
jgi:hypothetical protein